MNDEKVEIATEETEESQIAEPEAAAEAEDMEAQLADYKDRYVRAHAEMDNLRKRFDRERQEIVEYSKDSLLRDFLRVYDAIEKSIQMAHEHHPDDESFAEGLKMTEKILLDILKQNHVTPIETKDVAFDPNFHEALMQINREDMESNMVVDELEKGFMMHDRVLRPAKVTVSQ